MCVVGSRLDGAAWCSRAAAGGVRTALTEVGRGAEQLEGLKPADARPRRCRRPCRLAPQRQHASVSRRRPNPMHVMEHASDPAFPFARDHVKCKPTVKAAAVMNPSAQVHTDRDPGNRHCSRRLKSHALVPCRSIAQENFGRLGSHHITP